MKRSIFTAAVLYCLIAVLPAAGRPPALGGGGDGDLFYIHAWPDPVNIRNGNFYYPARDMFLPCFMIPIDITRSYNHFSVGEIGPFGDGWTFSYNVRLYKSSLGYPVVIEADGYRNEYIPSNSSTLHPLQLVVSAIVERRRAYDREKGVEQSDKFYDRYMKRLVNDPELREIEKVIYLGRGENPPEGIPKGEYTSVARGGSTMTITAGGAVRKLVDGTKEKFDKNGRLIEISDDFGNFLKIGYTDTGDFAWIKDSCGRTLAIKTDSDGLITSIEDNYGRKLSYDYSSKLLKAVHNISGGVTKYEYDKRRRMTRITYPDGQSISIGYYSKFDRVKFQQGPGPKKTRYRYGKKDDMFWREIIDEKGRTERFEFYIVQRRIVRINKKGQKTIKIMSACCGKPERITDPSGRIATFKYEPKSGRILERIGFDGRVVRYTYDPVTGFLTKVEDSDKGVTLFKYAPDGRATEVVFRDKSGVTRQIFISYGPRGKIGALKMGNEVFSFDYNFFGKPATITYKRAGKIELIVNTAYRPTGEVIKTTYRPDDQLKISSIMQRLSMFMSLIEPPENKVD